MENGKDVEPTESPDEPVDIHKTLQLLEDEVWQLYKFRDFFFENHPVTMALEKDKLIMFKMMKLANKFDRVNESEIPANQRAKYLYMKGRCYNIVMEYDPRALECFSKAVKLNPDMHEAWNELAESYWKNKNIKEAQACLETSLKRTRHPTTLQKLSILLRKPTFGNKYEVRASVLRSVECAKEAVMLSPKDGVAWSVLGNAYLCQFFGVEQDPNTLKAAMSAYNQAWNDPIARGTADLPFNKGIVSTYNEHYKEGMKCYEIAYNIEPTWKSPIKQIKLLTDYLQYVDDMVQNKGKIKIKRLQQMVETMVPKYYGDYAPLTPCVVNKQKAVRQKMTIKELKEGVNEGVVVLGRVIGSYHSGNAVPFTFAIIDESMSCIAVNVYNWADGRGAIINDCVCIPDPVVSSHVQTDKKPMYNFKSIRVNNPLFILINGKRPDPNQYAATKVTTTVEAS